MPAPLCLLRRTSASASCRSAGPLQELACFGRNSLCRRIKFTWASSNWKGGRVCFCTRPRRLRLGRNQATLDRQSPIDLAMHISSNRPGLRSLWVLAIARASSCLQRKHSGLPPSRLMALNWCISPSSLPPSPSTFLPSSFATCLWLSSYLFSQISSIFLLSTGPSAAQFLSKCVQRSFLCYFGRLTPRPKWAWVFTPQLP